MRIYIYFVRKDSKFL